MNFLQYSFILDSSHDMDAVRERVALKKPLLDHVVGMRWKAWLLSEPLPQQLQLKTYAPLYLFTAGEALANFLAGPVFKGVTDTFGWTKPLSGLPLSLVDIGLEHARSATLSTAPLLEHQALARAASEVCTLERGEVARVRMLVPNAMELRTYRFWETPTTQHAPADDLMVYEVVAVSRIHP